MLDLVRRVFDVIADDCISRWSWHALPRRDRDEVELVGVLLGDFTIDHSARLRIGVAAWISGEESGVDPLAAVDVHQLASVSLTDADNRLLDLGDLGAADTFDLTFSNTVSVDENVIWKLTVVVISKGLESVFEIVLKHS